MVKIFNSNTICSSKLMFPILNNKRIEDRRKQTRPCCYSLLIVEKQQKQISTKVEIHMTDGIVFMVHNFNA